MFKKFLLALVALFFIFVGSIWLLVHYVQRNPDSVFQFADKVIARFTAGKPYEEKTEDNIHGIQTLTIRTENANLEIHPVDGEILTVFYEGKAPRSERGPFIERLRDGSNLEVRLHEPMSSAFFSMNVNGQSMSKTSDVALRAKISVPRSYKGTLVIESNQGNIDMQISAGTVYEFDLRSDRGLVENTVVQEIPEHIQPQDIGKIQITSQAGNIHISN